MEVVGGKIVKDQFREWVLLHGDRYLIAGCILLVSSGAILSLLLSSVIRTTTPLYYLSSGVITGNITLITVVVAITQLVLSRELAPPGQIQDEIEETDEYRQTALNQQNIPTEPSDFLQQLFRQTHQHAHAIETPLLESADRQSEAESNTLITTLPDQCEQAADHLDQADDRLFNVISPILGTNYAEHIQESHRLQTKYDDEHHARLNAALDRLTTDLIGINVADHYFTTMFIKEELAKVSRLLLYVGIPAVAVPIGILIKLTTYTGSVLPQLDLVVLSVLAVMAGLLPLALLTSFVFRIATAAQRVAAIPPFSG